MGVVYDAGAATRQNLCMTIMLVGNASEGRGQAENALPARKSPSASAAMRTSGSSRLTLPLRVWSAGLSMSIAPGELSGEGDDGWRWLGV